MSTFTLQDLNLPMTAEDALKAIEQHEQPIEVPREVKDTLTEILHTRHVTEPQPTLGTDVPSQLDPQKIIDEMVSQFSIKLNLLLTTLITSSAPKPTEPEGNQSLQDCVALTLQQADWFKSMVGTYVDEYDFESHVHDAVKDCVESEIEHYFSHRFDPSEHFDFDDAVSNEVHDRIDDAVRDHIDDAVQEQLEELVAEKLKNVRVVFD